MQPVAHWSQGPLSVGARGIAWDSRRVERGQIFVAITGREHDGRRYIAEAIRRGAAAVVGEPPLGTWPVPTWEVADARQALAELASSFYGHPARELTVIGVTGTAGKSSTTEFLTAILAVAGVGVQTVGSLHPAPLDGPFPLTTPDAPILQHALREAVRAGCRAVVLEVSSHAIAMKRIGNIPFFGAVLTSLGHDHLDLHGSLAAYWGTKAELLAGVDPAGFTVLPAQGPGQSMMRRAARGRQILYGIRSGDVRLSLRREGEAVLTTADGHEALHFHLVGPGPLRSAAAAAAAGVALGIDLETIARGIQSVVAIPGRMERHPLPGGGEVVVDYAHNPPGLESALRASRGLAHGRVVAVLGGRGTSDASKLPRMGQIIERWADELVLTTDNPDPFTSRELARLIAEGVSDPDFPVHFVEDRVEAISLAVGGARAGDVVLVTGRGHETWQRVNGSLTDRTDSEMVRDILGGAGERTSAG